MKRYKLGDLIEVSRGASLSGQYYSSSGALKRLTLGNFDYANGGFKENTSKDNIFFTGEVKPEFVLNKGDIITPLTEQTPGLLGSTARIPESGKYIQSQDIALVRCKEGQVDPAFCYYLISSDSVKKQLGAAAQQTKIRHTSPDKIKDVIVDIPSLEEQRAIGVFLDALTSKIESARAINDYLEAMARQLYDYWFVQFDFPDVNGKPYKSSGGKMVWDEKLKRAIPYGWKDGQLIDIANITMGQSPDGSSYNETGDGILFYQGSTDFGIRFPSVRQYTNSPTRLAKKGDILMSVRAPVGAVNIANNDCCIGRGLAALNSKIGSITHLYFIIRDLKTAFDNKNAVGTTFGSITKDELFSLPVVVPDASVIERFESMCSPIFGRQMVIGKEVDDLIAQRDELLPLLMNGQVSVRQLNNHLSAD